MDRKNFICLRCPKECEISTKLGGYNIKETIREMRGNICKLGIDYVVHEIKDPNRVITTTVKVRNGLSRLVPVWTTNEMPKGKIFDLMSILGEIELEAPVKMDTLVLKNVFQTGVDIVTKGSVQRKNGTVRQCINDLIRFIFQISVLILKKSKGDFKNIKFSLNN